MIALSSSAWSASSWVGMDGYIGKNVVKLRYNIDTNGAPFPGNVECNGTATCVFGPFVRTGVGINWQGQLCDSGGWCGNFANAASSFRLIIINNRIPWQEAFEQYIATYGSSAVYSVSGPSYDSQYIRWDAMCTGFAVLPVRLATGGSYLAPNSICTPMTRPTISCSLTLDTNNLYLGQAVRNQQISLSSQTQGTVNCSGPAQVSLALLNEVKLDDRVPVTIKANSQSLSQKSITLGSANTQLKINFEAIASGVFDHTGTRSANAILSVNYY